MKRLSYQHDSLDDAQKAYDNNGDLQVDGGAEVRLVGDDEGNLVGSMTDVVGMHLPVIDIDHPCRLVESSTPGHFHLYIDVPVYQSRFFELLDVMGACGIVEKGYAAASRARGQAFVRKPHVKKAPAEPEPF